METIQVKDKRFCLSISSSDIRRQIGRIAAEISHDYAGQNPVFLAVLNGSFIFAADLLREVDLPCEVSFVKLASYEGLNSTGKINELIGLNVDISGRPVVIVEDIVESGFTLAHLKENLQKQNPGSIAVCTLLQKPEMLRVPLDVKYSCFQIPNDFVVGYGLDYDGFGRNTKDIYSLVEE